MNFFGLFKTKVERDRDAKLKFRQGKNRIQRFLQELRKSADNYLRVAQQAHHLDDQEQAKQLAANFMRCRESINRWERYLVKMDSLEMRRNEVEATGDFLRSMNALTGSILRGASPEAIAQMQMDVEQALSKSEEQEELLSVAMEAAGTTLTGSSNLDDQVLDQLIKSFGHVHRFTDPHGNNDKNEDEQSALDLDRFRS